MSKPTEQLEDMINRCRKYCSLETQVLIAEIDRLRAPRQAEGWQPIETAPKDGRLLLLYCDYGDGEREMYIAHYVIPIAPGGKFGPFIWKTQGSGGVAEKIPTHWMPLPEPPALCGGEREAKLSG